MELYLTYIEFLNILNYSLTSKNRKNLTYKFRYLLLLNGKTGEIRPVLWMHFDSCLRGASQVAQWWESAWKCRRRKSLGFAPYVRKIPWRRKWQLTPRSDTDRGHNYVFPMVVPCPGCHLLLILQPAVFPASIWTDLSECIWYASLMCS